MANNHDACTPIDHEEAARLFGDAQYAGVTRPLAAAAARAAAALRMSYSPDGMAWLKFRLEPDGACASTGSRAFGEEPDGDALFSDSLEAATETVKRLRDSGGRLPACVHVNGLGAFDAELGASRAESGSCGDGRKLAASGAAGRLEGKVAIVTGSAQGFGKGIANALAKEGARVVIADLNFDGAKECADELCAAFGRRRALAVRADVTDEGSVEAMVASAGLNYGGLDVFVSNAGVLIAGGLDEMTKSRFELVTGVNYTGYFLCAKKASELMKAQREHSPAYMTDIIEINSKSGLAGSLKNFAYAGSKFGGIGLTQSFALELVRYGIKVNAVCPGNLLDGPLWSDPERGLFRQYLDTGKVPGARTIADVRAFYEAKAPMNRGCEIGDVAVAILYVIEQKYETGQAVPVTGGQVMLS